MWLRVALAALVTTLACGGNATRTNETAGAGGTFAASGGSGAGGSSGASSSGGGAVHDGGSVPLTPEQLQALQESACWGWRVETDVLPIWVEWVVALDSTMALPAPGALDLSRWDVTRDNIQVAHDIFPEHVRVGALFHPNLGPAGASVSVAPQSIEACVNLIAAVPVDQLGSLDSAHRALLRSALQEASLGPGRPLSDAYARAVLERPGLPASFIVLITDGPPTLASGCSNPTGSLSPVDPMPLVNDIDAAFALKGIRTFVIGLPGSESVRDALSLAATVGGTARDCADGSSCYFDLSASEDLQAGFDAVVAAIHADILALDVVVPCEYSVPVPPAGQMFDPNTISVVVYTESGDNRLLLLDEFGDCSEGWRFKDASTIELCPDSCAGVQGSNSHIEMLFACSHEVPGGHL